MITQQTQVANVVNNMISLTQQLYAIQSQIGQVSAAWTNLSAANKLNAFPTAPLTSTGDLGTTDVTSVTSNPIDTRAGSGALLARAISANNLASLLTYLQGVQNAINGTAVSLNGAAPQLVALCL